MLFFLDLINDERVSWSDLIEYLNKQTHFNPYCYHSSFYEVFRHIILSLITGEEIILLDSDFSDEEVIKLTGLSDFLLFSKPIKEKIPVIKSKLDLLSRLENVNSNWTITLFTSGTTGLPKKVTHSFKSIARFVKKGANSNSNIWGYAYNPTHMAGIQVFLQALLNGNPIVSLFRLEKEKVFKSIEEFKITHISATPTFYRLLLPCTIIFPSLLRVTSGGEKFDNKTISQLSLIFPNAKINNVYASTEAGTLFASSGDIFTIKEDLSNLVKIINNELVIHNSIMGKSDFNESEWYYTGDLVEILSENPIQFKFVSRNNEMINVGGNKVNPSEVEEVIRKLAGVKDARVFSKSNSVLGNIICCEIVCLNSNLDEPQIRSFLQSNLQEFKIPRIFKFVNELSTTRTGKVKRN